MSWSQFSYQGFSRTSTDSRPDHLQNLQVEDQVIVFWPSFILDSSILQDRGRLGEQKWGWMKFSHISPVLGYLDIRFPRLLHLPPRPTSIPQPAAWNGGGDNVHAELSSAIGSDYSWIPGPYFVFRDGKLLSMVLGRVFPLLRNV